MSFRVRSFRHRPVSVRTFLLSRWITLSALHLGGVCALLLASALVLGAGGAPTHSQMLNSYGKLPLSFEANHGQIDNQVKFVARGAGYTLFLMPTEAVFSLQQRGPAQSVPSAANAKDNSQTLADSISNHGVSNRARKPAMQNNSVLRVRLLDADNKAKVMGLNELPGRTNYFRGNDPSKWTTGVATFAKVQYSQVLKGIDLVYYGNQGQLEYDFVVAPGADTRLINLKFGGARNLRVDKQTGDLVLRVEQEEIRFHKPVAYQNEASETRHLVAADYVIDSDSVSFALGQYDRSKPLIIDPTLSYSTYLGGASNDYATSIAVDNSGSAYVVGYTNSVNFPTTSGAFQTACSGGCSGTTVDAFVSKLDPTGSFLVYSTYLGGSGNDYGNGVALDASGDAYIIGQTFSKNFPSTPGAFQTKCGAGNCASGEAFITELNSTGSGLIYSTYLGGSGATQGNAIVLDASGDAYVTGNTQSLTFPVTPGAFQTTCSCSGQPDVFVTQLNPNGSALVYSTYLGGNKADVGYSIALDSSNNAYVVGYTGSTTFPTTVGAFQRTIGAGQAGFVTKLNSTGTALVYSTYLGGVSSLTTPCEACATAVTVDSLGDAYVCGLTAESNFPVTPGAYQTTFLGPTNGHDAFLTELNPAGSAPVFSTYLGGNGDSGSTGIGLDQSGNIWLKGNTKSKVFPVTPGAVQTTLGGAFDAFISEINPAGSDLLYSTYLGGSGTEYGGATHVLALDAQVPPNVYVTGYTNSTDYPVVAGSLQTTLAGENDAFVSKLSPSPNIGLSPASLNFGYQSDGTTSAPQTITLTNTGNTDLTITNFGITGPNSGDFAETNTCTAVLPQGSCAINVTFTPTISGNETADLSLTDNAPASPQLISLTGYGLGTGPAVVLSPTSLTFGTQLDGSSSQPKTVTLSNVGNAALAITSISVSPNFLQTNNCGSSVAAGASCTITVNFRPSTINTLTGSVGVVDNASGSPQTVALSGVGTVVALTPSSINFGSVTVGTSSPVRVATLANVGKVALAIQNLSITGTDPGDFSQTNTCGTSLPPAGKCTISITFEPTAKGSRSAAVSVTDPGGASPQSVTIIGVGQ